MCRQLTILAYQYYSGFGISFSFLFWFFFFFECLNSLLTQHLHTNPVSFICHLIIIILILDLSNVNRDMSMLLQYVYLICSINYIICSVDGYNNNTDCTISNESEDALNRSEWYP